MRLLIVGLSLALATTGSAFDAKSECLKALAEAKKAGLPTSPQNLVTPKSTKDSARIEAIFAKADKLMKRSLKPNKDFGKTDNKGAALPPYRQETPAEKTLREQEVTIALADLVSTKGPRVLVAPSDPIFGFTKGAAVKGLLTIELASVDASAKTGKAAEVTSKLKVARRLVELSRVDSSIVGVLGQVAACQKYYVTLERISKMSRSLHKAITPDLIASFPRPSIDEILRTEFLGAISVLMEKNWQLPADKDSLDLMTKNARGWTLAYPNLKSARTGKELEAKYKAIAPKLGVYKFKDGTEMTLGPSWAEGASALDKIDARRAEMLKTLGRAKG